MCSSALGRWGFSGGPAGFSSPRRCCFSSLFALAHLLFVALLVLAHSRVVARVVRVHRLRGLLVPAMGFAFGPINVTISALRRHGARPCAVTTLAARLLVS